MTLANNVDSRSSGLPDTSYFTKPDEAILSTHNRAQLGMVQDTLSAGLPFTQIGQDPMKNYQATPDRPLLSNSSNILSARVLLKPNGEATPEPDEYYQKIIDTLPEDLRTQYENPPLTNPLLTSLNSVWKGAANGLVTLDKLTVAPPADSPMEENSIAFSNLPATLGKSFSSMGSQMLSGMSNSLQSIGRNSSNYDNLSDLVNQTGESFGKFQNLLSAMSESPQPSNLNTLKGQVSDDVNRLSTLYNSKDNGSDMKLLGSFVKALSVVSGPLTTTNGNPSVMLAASLGTIGLDKPASSGGSLGPGLANINRNISEGISSLYMPNSTPSDQKMLTNLMNLTSVYGLGAGTMFAHADYGEASQEFPGLSNFGYQAGMAFASNSHLLPTMFGLLGSAAGISSGNVNSAGNAMSASFLVGLAYAGSKGSSSSFEGLINQISEPLGQSLTHVENDLNTGISNGTISGSKANAVNVGITHARLALKNTDTEGFVSAMNNMYDELGTGSDQINNDLKTLKGTAEVVQNAFSGAASEGAAPLTGIQRIA